MLAVKTQAKVKKKEKNEVFLSFSDSLPSNKK